ncbi:MAG: glycine--tRNA ligase, partial [Verrucomicrobia bacterium]|nr:glycine--tRNA ligase [Verrucomicrobiota bacterium]
MNEQANVSMETLTSLCKRRGFIYPGSEIYGGFNGFWDYGPLGCELKRNVREAWWKAVVQRRDDVVGLDSAIILHPRAWEASGHVGGFADPMVDCRQCRKRFRADQLCEEQGMKLGTAEDGKTLVLPEGAKCTACGSKDLTPPRAFNLMFETFVGPVKDESATAYLRPETAQGIFLNFNNVVDTARVKVPFGIAQIGKAFR